MDTYSTLIKPVDLTAISTDSVKCNKILRVVVATTLTFLEVVDRVYDILHGRVQDGHNTVRFDCISISSKSCKWDGYVDARINKEMVVAIYFIDCVLLPEVRGNIHTP